MGYYQVTTKRGKEHARQLIQEQYSEACRRKDAAVQIAHDIHIKRSVNTTQEIQMKAANEDKVCSKGTVTNEVREYAQGCLEYDYDNKQVHFTATQMVHADGTESKFNFPIRIHSPMKHDDKSTADPGWRSSIKASMFAKLHAALAADKKEKVKRKTRKHVLKDLPKSVSDLSIAMNTCKAGKLEKVTYMYKGHRADVTPRRHRVAPPSSVSEKGKNTWKKRHLIEV